MRNLFGQISLAVSVYVSHSPSIMYIHTCDEIEATGDRVPEILKLTATDSREFPRNNNVVAYPTGPGNQSTYINMAPEYFLFLASCVPVSVKRQPARPGLPAL